MKVLIACEFSGIVREAFIRRGHDAMSCDLLDTEISGSHYKGNVLDILDGYQWDLMIAHPPCTYLAGSGAHWLDRVEGRRELAAKALQFVCDLWNAPIDKICIENPVGLLSTWFHKPDQYIQPYQFGEDASKKTCLWLKNLPLLKPTKYIEPKIINGKKIWSNQTPSGQNKLGPSPTRSQERSRTYKGIAEAFAEQWSNL